MFDVGSLPLLESDVVPAPEFEQRADPGYPLDAGPLPVYLHEQYGIDATRRAVVWGDR